jgi:hypothetical protein
VISVAREILDAACVSRRTIARRRMLGYGAVGRTDEPGVFGAVVYGLASAQIDSVRLRLSNRAKVSLPLGSEFAFWYVLAPVQVKRGVVPTTLVGRGGGEVVQTVRFRFKGAPRRRLPMVPIPN